MSAPFYLDPDDPAFKNGAPPPLAPGSAALTGGGYVNPQNGLLTSPDGVPVVTNLPAGWTAKQALDAGLAQPPSDANPPAPVAPPPAAPAPVPKHMETDATSTTSEKVTLSPEKKDLQQQQIKLTGEAVAAEKKSLAVNEDLAKVKMQAANEDAVASQQRVQQQQQIISQGEQQMRDELGRLQAAFDAKQKLGFRDYWSQHTTGDHVLAILGVMLAGKPALDQLNRAIDIDLSKQKFDIDKAGEAVDFAKMRMGLVHGMIEDRQANFQLTKAAALESSADKLKAMLMRSGVPAAQAESDQRVVAIRQESLKVQQQLVADTSRRVSSTVQRKLVEGTAGGAGGGHVTASDVEHVNRLNGDLQSIDRTIAAIKAKPDSWSEYRDNLESWKRKEAASGASSTYKGVRGVLQGIGIANVTPDQGLNTPGGRVVHRGMEDVGTSIAKGYGGVITEGDRAAAGASLGSLATQNPMEAIKTLETLRAKLAASRDNFITNRGVNPGPTAPPGISAPAAGAPAAAAPAPRPLTPADHAAAARWLQSADAKRPENRAKRLRVAQELSMLGAGP